MVQSPRVAQVQPRLYLIRILMRKLIQRAVNVILSPASLEIRRKLPPQVPLERYVQLLDELHDCYVDKVFPNLPLREKRLALLVALTGMRVTNAFYLLDALHKSLMLPGDVCEFGVALGTTSALLANEIRNTGKNLWLFDSFLGLSKPTEKDQLLDDVLSLGSMEAYEGAMAIPAEVVMERLKEIAFPPSRTKIVSGFIEETLAKKNLPTEVCFAFVDFDLYEPILATLNYLSEALSAGGFIVVHDYGFLSSGAKTAVDEFLLSKGGFFQKNLPPHYAGYFIVMQKLPNVVAASPSL